MDTPDTPNPSPDISGLLRDWPYESGKLNVRLIVAEDGEPRIQMRLDLGILQMHTEGRPDGQRPYGCDSVLEHHEQRLDDHTAEHGSGSGFVLTEEHCRELREEAAQFYHRYMALLVLEDFEGVVRDTGRNLRVLDLCARFAETEADRQALEPFRAYITMMRARALASQAIKDSEPKAAVQAIEDGIEALREHFAATGQESAFDASSEVQALRGMREAIIPKLPVSQTAELRKRLDAAVKAEKYELAAILRDELKSLGETPNA
ncbi:MAG: UvrB/UvrC motif-containing protein [Phycisphaeraceae bacterium]|nr:UvrB/UvrC motif-containing protein [Phycisphaeraceae bacterium]